MTKRICRNGSETDAFTDVSKRALVWRRGERAAIKRRANRRERRAGRNEITEQMGA